MDRPVYQVRLVWDGPELWVQICVLYYYVCRLSTHVLKSSNVNCLHWWSVVDFLPMAKPEADSHLGIRHDWRAQIFVWCRSLVVPSEGHGSLLHFLKGEDKMTWTRILWDRGTRVVWPTALSCLVGLTSWMLLEVVVGIAHQSRDKLLTKKATSNGR